MPMFEYTARGQNGQIQRGQLDVSNKDDVSAYLRKNRLILVSVREAPKQIKFSMGGSRVQTRDIVIFTRQFATMINAGLPLVQSLNILAAQTGTRRSPMSRGRWSTTSRAATRWPTPSRGTPRRSRRCT
jgi:type IV pilus assembly protein PilC